MFLIVCSWTCVKKRSPDPVLLCTTFGSFFLTVKVCSFPRGHHGALSPRPLLYLGGEVGKREEEGRTTQGAPP